jgi:uncharacterized membrane protein
MNHDNFETHMIDFVNRNAQEEEVIRGEALREQMESAANLKRKKATKAVIEYILWVIAVIGVVALMSFAYYLGIIQADIAIPASSLFTFIAGVRINTLAIRISKYGGRLYVG